MFIIKGVKIVPQEIYDLLSPMTLVHWIMSDGASIKNGGVLLCTDSYTISDVCKLINVLKIKFNLNCTLQFYGCIPIIYIKKKY